MTLFPTQAKLFARCSSGDVDVYRAPVKSKVSLLYEEHFGEHCASMKQRERRLIQALVRKTALYCPLPHFVR